MPKGPVGCDVIPSISVLKRILSLAWSHTGENGVKHKVPPDFVKGFSFAKIRKLRISVSLLDAEIARTYFGGEDRFCVFWLVCHQNNDTEHIQRDSPTGVVKNLP